jgi:hypothetical protein
MAAKKRIPKPFTPSDYLMGGKRVGQKYTAWNTYGQGKPDFGKGAGPGEPYHKVTKTNLGKDIIKRPDWGNSKTPVFNKPTAKNPKFGVKTDPRTAAIRKRLGWS